MARRSPRAVAEFRAASSSSARSPVTSRRRRIALPPIVRPSMSMKRLVAVRAVRRNASPRCLAGRARAPATRHPPAAARCRRPARAGPGHLLADDGGIAFEARLAVAPLPAHQKLALRPHQQEWRDRRRLAKPLSRPAALASARAEPALPAPPGWHWRPKRRRGPERARNTHCEGRDFGRNSASPAGVSGTVTVRSMNGTAISPASAAVEALARRPPRGRAGLSVQAASDLAVLSPVAERFSCRALPRILPDSQSGPTAIFFVSRDSSHETVFVMVYRRSRRIARAGANRSTLDYR